MKRRDTSFYYSFLVLPPDKRNAIVAVWDFCRAVDDAVDEIAPDSVRGEGLPEEVRQQAAASLAAWRQELAAVYESQPSTPQGTALQPFVGRFNLPRSQFEALIDGVEMDLSLHRYPNFETLVQYCHRVASSVGLICVEIFGYEDPRTRDYAVSLGVALQLTNIVRDVAVDLKTGDRVWSIRGVEVFSAEECGRLWKQGPAGEPCELVVVRKTPVDGPLEYRECFVKVRVPAVLFPAGFAARGTLSGQDVQSINVSVTEAPLRLVEHVVRNDLPLTEIVTADYVMADSNVATVWGLPYSGTGDSLQPERCLRLRHGISADSHLQRAARRSAHLHRKPKRPMAGCVVDEPCPATSPGRSRAETRRSAGCIVRRQ